MSQVFRRRAFAPDNSDLFRFEGDQKRRAERNPMVDFDKEPVLALFWCNQAESGGAIVKKPRQLIECQRVPTPSLTKTDSTVLISLKTWDFLVPGDSDLHQKRARTI